MKDIKTISRIKLSEFNQLCMELLSDGYKPNGNVMVTPLIDKISRGTSTEYYTYDTRYTQQWIKDE